MNNKQKKIVGYSIIATLIIAYIVLCFVISVGFGISVVALLSTIFLTMLGVHLIQSGD